MVNYRRFIYFLTILLVVIIALWLRLRAVDLLPIDYDEDDYLAAGQRYAQALAAGDINRLIDYNFNYEHPPLPKIVYGLALLPLPPAPLLPELGPNIPPAASLPEPHFHVARLTAAAISTVQVLALALFDPLAGLLLAIHTWQIKYTAQVMLEPLPALTSTLTILFYIKSKNSRKPAWLLLSAIALGLTAAGKYLYCVAGIAIVIDWLWRIWSADENQETLKTFALSASSAVNSNFFISWLRRLTPIFIWGVAAILVFFMADPRLWHDPLNRLWQTILFHGNYAQSEHVRQAGFPVWQPLVWLFGSVPWHPGVFVFSLDLGITILAWFGLRRLWSQQRVLALWLAVALLFLFIWPTKWPQYILILTAPLSVAAAAGFRAKIWEPGLAWWQRWRAGQPAAATQFQARPLRNEWRAALPWLLPGAIVLTLITLFPLLYQSTLALTDITNISIRDGIQGGVWREVWRGLTGQVKPVNIDLFAASRPTSTVVHYAGPGVLLQFVTGLGADVLFFNLLWTVLAVLTQTALGLAAGLLIQQRGVRFKGFWRTLFILPWAIPEFVGAVIWFRLFEPRFGWVNLAAIPAGVTLPDWFKEPYAALSVLLLAAAWSGFPLMMLATTAGLKLIPPESYDAAAIDGAGRAAQLRYITWPLLQPLLVPAIIIRAIFTFNQFYLFYVTQPRWPLTTLSTLSFFVFNYGGAIAVSASINIFAVLVLVILILWFNHRSRAVEGVTYV